MKRFAVLACLTITLLGSLRAADSTDPQLSVAIKEIQAQQALIADNQAKIDAKLVTIAEAVRVARIYASRGGR